MGQTPGVLKNKLTNQWTYIDTLGKFQIFKNQHNQLAQKHIIRTDPKIDETDYITAYHQRYLPNKPIVNAYDAEFQHKSNSMCQNSSVMTVFTEYIPYRLCDVKMLNHGQGIYVLSEALAGFAELFGRVGPFQISEDLIGFNQEGEVKMWYNPNFADNSVDNDRIILMSTVNPYDFDRKFSQNQEHDMVEDTINAVARYTKFHPQFLQQAHQLKKVGFAEARRILANEIGRKAYYVPDHLFLSDRNDIIKKSGIQLKHKHTHNPNKPKKGQTYPYFIQGQQRQQGQTHYLQGQPPHPNYNYKYDNDSQSSYSDDYNGQGYYNMNGQNYRVVATKEFEGNNINEQQIIEEVMRNNNNQNQYAQQSQYYASDPHYASVRSGVYMGQHNYDTRVQQPSSYVRKPKYQEGHIVINDSSHHSRSNHQHINLNPQYQPQQVPQQDTVRVFSIGEDGRLHEESHLGGHSSQLQYGERVQPNQSIVQPHFVPQQPGNRRMVINDPIVAPVYSTRYTTEVPNQSVRHELPAQTDLHFQSRHVPEPQYINTTHRHRIFEPSSPTVHQNLVREESQVYPQRVF